MREVRIARDASGRFELGRGPAYGLPAGYEARVGPDGRARLYSPAGRPCGPYAGRWGGPCVRTDRGGMLKLEPAGEAGGEEGGAA